MKTQYIAISLTVINLVLLIYLLTQFRQPGTLPQPPNNKAVLRGSGLEITDSLGRVRASIKLEPSSIVNGKMYPASVLLRLIDSQGQPSVKLGAGEDGGALSLAEESQGYIQALARSEGCFIKIKNQDGKEQVFKP